MNEPLLTFYGDDFTGSTDAMECLELNGMPAVLFLEPPTRQMVDSQFPDVRAVGVAGISRSMTPSEMDEELPPRFTALKELEAPFFHYKVCSTFDSSPTVGSIGHAIDIGWRIFEPVVVPMMVGAPFLRRYVAFGNLFARVGDTTYRLDRHPTMSKHPITPMHESDLRLHLARQTRRRMELIDLWHLSHSEQEIEARFRRLIADGAEIVLFDTLDKGHMMQIGRLIWALKGDRTVFLVGSSGFEYSLGMYLRSQGLLTGSELPESAGEKKPIVVVSGSCAPGTSQQIAHGLDHGFQGIRLNCPELVHPDRADAEREATIVQALEVLGRGESLILYSARGPDDPAITETKQRLEQLGLGAQSVGRRLGSELGRVLRAIVERAKPKRVCVTGGDTCGYATRELGIYALRVVTPIAPGAPLCCAFSKSSSFDGLEIALKGGQNGTASYFSQILQGNT